MGESIIFATYFAREKDPQRGKYWTQNDFTNIKSLYDSVKALGLDMIIFHDHLSKQFISKYSTDKITFEKHTPTNKNATTARFLCYLSYLKRCRYENIMCLDCGDLELYKDPFPLIDDRVIIGSEDGLIGDSTWMTDRFLKVYDRVYYEDKVILNCGILGGKRNNIIHLLSLFRDDINKTQKNVDMAVFNKIIYDGIPHNTGYPIHTIFNNNEDSQSGCYIRHK